MYRWSATFCVLATVAADFNGCETTSAIQNSESRQLDEKYAQLQSMEQIVDSFSGIKWSDDPAQRKANAQVLDSFLKTIEEHMETFLLKEHDEDQVEWSTSIGTATACYNSHWQVVAEQEKKWDMSKWEKPTEHSSSSYPLGMLKTKFETCMIAHYAWDEYAGKAKICQEIPTFGNREHHHMSMCDWMECAKDVFTIYKDTSPIDDTSPGADCALEQNRFEDAFCKLRDDLQTSCNTRTSCLAGEDFNTIRPKLEERTKNRAALWKTMQVLKCRVKHLLGDKDESDTFSGFKNGSFDNASYASDYAKKHECDGVDQFIKFEFSDTAGPTDCYNEGNPGTSAVSPMEKCILNLAPLPVPPPMACPAFSSNPTLCNCPVCLHPDHQDEGCEEWGLPIHQEDDWECKNFIDWQYNHFDQNENVTTVCGDNLQALLEKKAITRCRATGTCDVKVD